MTQKLLALIAKHQLQLQWENPNEGAQELLEPDDEEPCTLIVTAADGTIWSTDYENTVEGRETVLQQLLLEADEVFFTEEEDHAEEPSFVLPDDIDSEVIEGDGDDDAPLSIDEEE